MSAYIDADAIPDVHQEQRPTVRLPGKNRPHSDFAAECGRYLAHKDIFKRGGHVFFVEDDEILNQPALINATAVKFRTWSENHLVFFRAIQRGDQQFTNLHQSMSVGDAETVLESPQFQFALRPLKHVNPIPLPILQNTVLELLPEGYHGPTSAFTMESVPGTRCDMPLEQARNLLEELYGEFTFLPQSAQVSKAVAIAAMMTLYGRMLLTPCCMRPCFIYLGNAEGCGKTLCAKLAVVPVLGQMPTMPLPEDENEMRKLIDSVSMEAAPVLFLDNIKRRLNSPTLEAFLTSQTWTGRVLGASKTFTVPTEATVFVTGNGCTVTPDLRRRSLFCELFLEQEKAEEKPIRRRLDTGPILELRPQIGR